VAKRPNPAVSANGIPAGMADWQSKPPALQTGAGGRVLAGSQQVSCVGSTGKGATIRSDSVPNASRSRDPHLRLPIDEDPGESSYHKTYKLPCPGRARARPRAFLVCETMRQAQGGVVRATKALSSRETVVTPDSLSPSSANSLGWVLGRYGPGQQHLCYSL